MDDNHYVQGFVWFVFGQREWGDLVLDQGLRNRADCSWWNLHRSPLHGSSSDGGTRRHSHVSPLTLLHHTPPPLKPRYATPRHASPVYWRSSAETMLFSFQLPLIVVASVIEQQHNKRVWKKGGGRGCEGGGEGVREGRGARCSVSVGVGGQRE